MFIFMVGGAWESRYYLQRLADFHPLDLASEGLLKLDNVLCFLLFFVTAFYIVFL